MKTKMKVLALILAMIMILCTLSACNTGTVGPIEAQGDTEENSSTPTIEISEDGYWIINGKNTNILAKGEKGDKGDSGPQGPQGESCNSNETSFPKNSISISCDGHLIVDGEKTDIVFQHAVHTFSEWTTTVSPSADRDGMRIRVCSDCDKVESETIHTFDDNGECINCAPIKAALITLHGTNSTYDKDFIEAFETACKNKGLNESNYTIITDIPENHECYNKAADLADNGYDVVFADSFGHEAFMIKAAKEFPEVEFCHATGTKAHTEGLDNYHNAFASIYQGKYLAGVAAGLKLVELYGDAEGKVSDENAKIGYVGAHPYAEVVSGYTSFYLGVKSIVENVTMEVRYADSWYDETYEKTIAEALIASGCKLISQHADSMGAPTACENANIPNVAYNGTTGKNTFVIASRIDWVPYFEYMLDCVINNKSIATDWTGTLANGAVKITALGNAAAAGTQAKLDEVAAKLNDGSLKVFDCSTFTVNGAHITEYLADVDDAGDFVGETNVIKTENGVTFFDESYFRSAPYFDLRIDGITEVA